MKIFSLLLVGALSGCITTTEITNQSIKVQQAYFAELSAYYLLLDAAGRYKDECFAHDSYLQKDCRAVVAKLREVAIRVKEVRDLTDRAIAINSEGSIVIATEKLRELQAEMKKELASGAGQPSPVLPPDWEQPAAKTAPVPGPV